MSEVTNDIRNLLDEIVGGGNVTTKASSLAECGVTVAVGGPPAWLVRPGSAGEVSELIRLANRGKIAVIPIGKASRTTDQSSIADRPRMLIDSTRMNHVLHLDETSLIVHVQAGLGALALENVLAPRGLSLGDYPPAALGPSIGGLLAVRTPGKSSARHGFIEDAVLGLSAVLADGRTIHTRVAPRRATGPDLARALCGSEGTLGFITSAVLRIHRRPERRLLAAHALPSFNDALAAVRLALREEAAPAAMRVYDTDEARAHLGHDVCDDGESILVVATAGPTDLAACDRELVASAAEAVGGRSLDESVAETWWQRRIGRATPPELPMPTLQVSATPGKQHRVYEAVLEASRSFNLRARAHASRFGPDGGVLFFTITNPDGSPSSDALLDETRLALESSAAEAGASLLGADNRALAPYFEDLRRQLDKNGIMNPTALVSEPR